MKDELRGFEFGHGPPESGKNNRFVTICEADSKNRHKRLKKEIENSMSLVIESAHLTISLTKAKLTVFQFNEVDWTMAGLILPERQRQTSPTEVARARHTVLDHGCKN